MAAFSSSFQHHHPFQLLDSSSSVLLPNSAINFDHPNNAFPPFTINDSSPFTVANKTSMDSESVVTDKYHEPSPPFTPNPTTSMDDKRKSPHSSSPNSAQSKCNEHGWILNSGWLCQECNFHIENSKLTPYPENSSYYLNQHMEMREVKGKKQKKMKGCEEPPTGYIHVRARRGQATDSHSLAERVRRERISERMKLLQALVPGCDKVTGKALMLDEIINYVQSLQNQVEFLSMKLASVNPISYDFGMDLESLMVRPDQSLSSLPSPFPAGMHEGSPTTGTTYPLLDNSANSLLLQQANAFPLGERHVLWEVDEQRQKIINQSAVTNSLFSFPLM